MELWLIISSITTISVCAYVFLKSNKTLPPGPPSIPILSGLLWLLKSFSELEPILRNLRAKYGPIITLRIGYRPAIFISTHSLAHQALVQNGALFADRPPPLPISKVLSTNQHNISSASYGPTWRLLRRNLTSQILHPSRLKSYSKPRKWVLDILINSLSQSQSQSHHVLVRDHFQNAMFYLLVLLCFGDKLQQDKIKEVERVQRAILLSLNRFTILNFWPSLTKFLFRRRWDEFLQLRRDQAEVLIPLIRARATARARVGAELENSMVVSYVDTLLDLQLPEEKRKLEEVEIVSLCSEFLDAGTDTTSTALQWILANLVKYSYIQDKVFEEILGVVGSNKKEEIKEEELERMPYLKAVILEGLRRHPPGHFVLPHAVTEDTVVEGFLIPKNASVNFMIAEMGWDPKVWDDPMSFKPERFLNNDIDITGSREIKMMPFGVGRRICPGYNLAILHLEYFVANLIWNFKWTPLPGDHIDLSEKQEFTVVMKTPLKAHLSPRISPFNS
ncbi:cytochrome P450 89A2-like [Euphorbia lathyris]|uniref:cytochrome P450 89A2-like n=1 Tax=Euphorbia lathyris TaxID=212925 RepID=UPI00331351E5